MVTISMPVFDRRENAVSPTLETSLSKHTKFKQKKDQFQYDTLKKYQSTQIKLHLLTYLCLNNDSIMIKNTQQTWM